MARAKSGVRVGSFIGAGLVVAFLAGACGNGIDGPSTSRPDWCVMVDKADGQMYNIGSGASNQTATIDDEAHFFDQLADDLNNVALTADGANAAAGQAGSIDAGQVRVRLLSGQGPGGAGADLKTQMATLDAACV